MSCTHCNSTYCHLTHSNINTLMGPIATTPSAAAFALKAPTVTAPTATKVPKEWRRLKCFLVLFFVTCKANSHPIWVNYETKHLKRLLSIFSVFRNNSKHILLHFRIFSVLRTTRNIFCRIFLFRETIETHRNSDLFRKVSSFEKTKINIKLAILIRIQIVTYIIFLNTMENVTCGI